ncbi:MAG TPA: glycosyltransferase [Thermoanaerobaculia bacterium]|nr:glycosyltransferase [Thermoanaerobaculia bacterium]
MSELRALGAPAVLALYYLTLGVLALYGAHRLLLVWVYRRTRGQRPQLPSAPADWPVVTVQLPLYNEMYVARRLLDAVAALDYPADRLEIQVLDDSTDETVEVTAEQVAYYQRRGLSVVHLRRGRREGYKAGALEAGLASARGELIAVFDADFVPAPDFLKRTVPFLTADPGLGMVQARWSHLNRRFSLLTRIQAIFLDGHFWIEHSARHRGGCFFNFNGTAGIWRRAAIESAGGWEHDTVTEDLDLSYRAQLAGWRFLYLPELAVASELPVDINGFKSQQRRWAQGSVQTGRKLLGRLLSAPLPWRVKLEAFVHLTNNLAYPLMVLLSLLVFPAMVLRRGSSPLHLLALDLPMFLAATASVLLFYAESQRAEGEGSSREIWLLPAVMGLGIGLALSNSLAVLAGLVRRGGVFERTPKYALARRGEEWQSKRYQSRSGVTLWLEGLFALYFLGVTGTSALTGMWLSLPFLYLFLQGYCYIFLLSLLPNLRARRGLPRPTEPGEAMAESL